MTTNQSITIESDISRHKRERERATVLTRRSLSPSSSSNLSPAIMVISSHRAWFDLDPPASDQKQYQHHPLRLPSIHLIHPNRPNVPDFYDRFPHASFGATEANQLCFYTLTHPYHPQWWLIPRYVSCVTRQHRSQQKPIWKESCSHAYP